MEYVPISWMVTQAESRFKSLEWMIRSIHRVELRAFLFAQILKHVGHVEVLGNGCEEWVVIEWRRWLWRGLYGLDRSTVGEKSLSRR